jgi:hypothetical protein
MTYFAKPRRAGEDRAGTFIARLPVNQEFTCEAGRAIWGFPKSVKDGDHPIAKELVEFGIGAEAQMSTWTEHMHGTFEAPTLR